MTCLAIANSKLIVGGYTQYLCPRHLSQALDGLRLDANPKVQMLSVSPKYPCGVDLEGSQERLLKWASLCGIKNPEALDPEDLRKATLGYFRKNSERLERQRKPFSFS